MNNTSAPCGLLIMDKPEGFTSFDLCAKLKGMLHQRHIGHTGTLDPMATGVMVILLGNTARLAELLPDQTKRYTAGFALGMTSDTLDSTGTVTRSDCCKVTTAQLEAALEDFRGDIDQIPPMYSAVHVDGQRLYKLARQGIEIEREPRRVHINRLSLLSFDEERQEGSLDVECSKGTYIRTLLDDIGTKLGCGGIMTELRRTKASGFTIEQAVTLNELRQYIEQNRLGELLIPPDRALMALPGCTVSDKQAQRYRNGGGLDIGRITPVDADGKRVECQLGNILRVYSPDGFIGVGRISEPLPGKDNTAEQNAENITPQLVPYKKLT